MPLNPDSGFNRVAPFYDQLATLVFGSSLKKAQKHFLHKIPKNSKILIVGGGTGWILTEVLTQCNPAQIVYLEASGKMLRFSEKKLKTLPQSLQIKVSLIEGNENSLSATAAFDVIITNFLLDLFPPERLKPLMQKLNHTLNENGMWLVTDFQLSPKPPFWQKLLAKSMYLFFNLMSNVKGKQLPELKQEFSKLNFRLKAEQHFYKKFIAAQVYQKKDN